MTNRPLTSRGGARRRLTNHDLAAIANRINDLDARNRPTWEQVVDAAHSVTRRTFTRQALCQHEQITAAYDAKLTQHRLFRQSGKEPKRPGLDEEPWERELADLRAENNRLKAQVAELDKRTILHIANAMRFNIPTRELEKPTKKHSKDATDIRLIKTA